MTNATDTHQIAGYELVLADHPGGIVSLHVRHAGLGGREIDALRRTYATADEAVAAKRNAWKFLASGGRIVEHATGRVDLIPAAETRAEALRRYLAEQDGRRARGMHDRAGVAAAEAELAALEGDELAALRERLRSSLIANLAA